MKKFDCASYILRLTILAMYVDLFCYRYNNFKHDPLSACNCTPPYSGENAISARSDLNPANGTYQFPFLGHRCHGGTDNKVIGATVTSFFNQIFTIIKNTINLLVMLRSPFFLLFSACELRAVHQVNSEGHFRSHLPGPPSLPVVQDGVEETLGTPGCVYV